MAPGFAAIIVVAATLTGAAGQHGMPLLPEPLPPLAAPEPVIPRPTIPTVADVRRALHRARRVYLVPSDATTLRRQLRRELKKWGRFELAVARRHADVEMSVGQGTVMRGFVGADGVNTHLPPESRIFLTVRQHQQVLWAGSEASMSAVLGEFKDAMAAADAPGHR